MVTHAAPENPHAAPENPHAAPENPHAAPENPHARKKLGQWSGRVIGWRRDHRWTQQDLATYLGVARSTVARWEAGAHPARRHRALLIALDMTQREVIEEIANLMLVGGVRSARLLAWRPRWPDQW